MLNPYVDLDSQSFWSKGVANQAPFNIENIYKKKWDIFSDQKIATAGSCFAQHISTYMRDSGYNVLDVEKPPTWTNYKNGSVSLISSFDSIEAKNFGYCSFSARYGNIYTVHQLLQLLKECLGLLKPQCAIWEKKGRYFDALRPSVEPNGLDSAAEVVTHRLSHLERVKLMFQTMDVFIFTLGLTEAWIHSDSLTVFPTAPGVVAGTYDQKVFSFKNYNFNEIFQAFIEFKGLLDELRNGHDTKIMLTVSPVPLTATASNRHILLASTYSKSILRSVAGQLEQQFDNIDYFPSYEIITNPAARGVFYDSNLRTVSTQGVGFVMKSFFAEHKNSYIQKNEKKDNEVDSLFIEPLCEDALLEAFAK